MNIAVRIPTSLTFAALLLLSGCGGGSAKNAANDSGPDVDSLQGTGYHCYEGPSDAHTPGVVFSVDPATGEKRFISSPTANGYANDITIGVGQKTIWETRTVSAGVIAQVLALNVDTDPYSQYAVNFGYNLYETREILPRTSDVESASRWFNDVFALTRAFNPTLNYYVVDDVFQARRAVVQLSLDADTAEQVSAIIDSAGRSGHVRRASATVFENVYQGPEFATVCYKVRRFTAQRDLSIGSITYIPTEVSEAETLFR